MRTTMRKHKRKNSEVTRVRSMAPSYRSNTARAFVALANNMSLSTRKASTQGVTASSSEIEITVEQFLKHAQTESWAGDVGTIIFTIRCRILKLNTTGCYIVPYTEQHNTIRQGSPGHACFCYMKCDWFRICAATKSYSSAACQRELNSKLVEPSSEAKNIRKFLYA